MARGWKACHQHRRYNHECGGCIGLNITRFKSRKAAENKALQAGTALEPIDRLGDACIAFNNELASVIMDVAIEQIGRADQLQHAAAILRGEA